MVMPLGDREPVLITPVATYTLIALNVILFVIQVQRGEVFTTSYAATPYEITHNVDIVRPIPVPITAGIDDGRVLPRLERVTRVELIPQGPGPSPIWLTLLTSMFLHGGFMHLAGNMLYLWIFGDNVEEVLGHVRFVLVYLGCGLVASLTQILANPDSLIPTLGASGAIAGVMGAYLVWFPLNRVRVLFGYMILEVPAILTLGLWVLLQIFSGIGSLGTVGTTGGVAYLAHAGGALCGIAVGLSMRDYVRRTRRPYWQGRIPDPYEVYGRRPYPF
ncbi:MAG: rhomboid family intramembrane serine protease [Isosphaeraceae bacterium]|jgi:membrane associated rhomboid family serine protease|nr:MAG: rhomboid family intramembrane serine protease [Isosphaeraceae bacterium]